MNGKLGDIGFVELLKMIGKKTGRLSIDAPRDQHYEWFIHEFRVFAARINDEPVKNQEVLLETALELINDEASAYRFVTREELERFPIEMSFNLEQVIAEGLTQLTTDASCRKHFPNPETRFEAVPNGDVKLIGDNLFLWRRAEYFFVSGANARSVAAELKIGLEETRLEFYRWRISGLITPVRVFSAVANKFPLKSASWQKILKTPRPASNGLSATTATGNSSAAKSPPSSAPPHVFHGEELNNEKRQTLVLRMLSALFER